MNNESRGERLVAEGVGRGYRDVFIVHDYLTVLHVLFIGGKRKTVLALGYLLLFAAGEFCDDGYAARFELLVCAVHVVHGVRHLGDGRFRDREFFYFYIACCGRVAVFRRGGYRGFARFERLRDAVFYLDDGLVAARVLCSCFPRLRE